jgi:primosomal replication protein N
VQNQVRLAGTVVAREALRHTPAGVPVLTFSVKHESTQVEGGVPRQVGLEIDAMAMGDVAQGMSALQAGQSVRLAGFLASRSRLSTRVVLHVNQFEIE